jgi:predicted dehydrogenase
MTKLRWGVLGVARIATAKVIPAMRRCRNAEVTALASRDSARATAAASSLRIRKAYGSYEELLADPDIDAIYNPLPNHLHVPWTIRAAESGKHVLCEKPIALSVAETNRLITVRDVTGKQIQEAFMVRAHPQWIRARQLVRDGRIGTLRSMLGYFSYFNDDPANIRNIPEIGGGALMDIGCYLINTSRFIFEREPVRVAGFIEHDPKLQVDRLTSIMLDYGSGHAIGTCSTQLTPYQRIQIVGTKGRIDIIIPFNAPPDRPCQIVVDTSTDYRGTGAEIIELPVCDQYTIQADLFSRAVLEGRAVDPPLEDAVANMICIEAVFKSAAIGTAERLNSRDVGLND